MKACETCRFWSDLIAEVPAGGSLVALCLEPTQPQVMRPGDYGCGAWKDAPFGAVDEPCDGPNPYGETQLDGIRTGG